MTRGKSQYATWYCSGCGMAGEVTYYNKVNNDKIMKDKKRYCPKCRKHMKHARKDTKKGSA